MRPWCALLPSILLLVPLPARAADPPCTPDGTLSEAAAELLLDDDGTADGALSSALRRAGSDLPSAHALWMSGDAGDEGGGLMRWLRSLERRSDGELVCGQAVGDGVRLVLAADRGGWLEVVPGGVRVRLADGFGEPHLVMREADGGHRRMALDPGALGSTVPIPADLRLPVTVQLVATGPSGPRPVAVRVVGSDRLEGTPGTVRPAPGPLTERLEELRALHGASPLRSNRLLDEEARRHARQVCSSGRVAHEVRPGADPKTRLGRRGIRARVVGEVVARAHDDAAAFDALVDSPSHRMAMVDRRFTDVGVGRVRRRGRLCLVVLLAAWPRYSP